MFRSKRSTLYFWCSVQIVNTMEFNFTDIIILILGLTLFGFEVLILKFVKKKTVSLPQTALNIGLGMLERLTGILTINFGIYVFSSLVPFRFFEPLDNKWLAFGITFIAVDFMWYIYHRISHRISLIWAAHLIHHQSIEYNFSVNFAISPFGFFVRIFTYSILILFGITPEHIILANALNAFYQYMLHSELWPEFKGWERILVTPKFHQIHHSSVHEHLDTNYGGMFTIWDRLFGTYYVDNKEVVYGLTKPIVQQDLFHLQILFFLRLIKNFQEFPFFKAFILLFKGPEAQKAEIPRLYNLKVQHSPLQVIFGFSLFLVGFSVISFNLLPIWLGFIIGMIGIFICSGIRFRQNSNDNIC